ncbi:hypothetical protein EA462_12490 [Natrarchaeobius halalkaliphilus]|uniref:Uncharacterized protein n=1 Tax=Natrarchaeobius halalkaliphilus TaxID=1679091 RepID=A0A3N6LKJ4_9EURY|nr:hypothetical protein [Natrarchaeobius halalkaliphilus]RQG89178.1 hypothetical protein EA462_12490 [Natrarchaeobius halalkaliphilus]
MIRRTLCSEMVAACLGLAGCTLPTRSEQSTEVNGSADASGELTAASTDDARIVDSRGPTFAATPLEDLPSYDDRDSEQPTDWYFEHRDRPFVIAYYQPW